MKNRWLLIFCFQIDLRKSAIVAIALILQVAALPFAVAHEGESHNIKKEKHHVFHPNKEAEEITRAINESYLATVKPVFRKSCFDCHSSNTNYPWYSNLPGAKQLIQNDIAEAKEHLDMSKDFPFQGPYFEI